MGPLVPALTEVRPALQADPALLRRTLNSQFKILTKKALVVRSQLYNRAASEVGERIRAEAGVRTLRKGSRRLHFLVYRDKTRG